MWGPCVEAGVWVGHPPTRVGAGGGRGDPLTTRGQRRPAKPALVLMHGPPTPPSSGARGGGDRPAPLLGPRCSPQPCRSQGPGSEGPGSLPSGRGCESPLPLGASPGGDGTCDHECARCDSVSGPSLPGAESRKPVGNEVQSPASCVSQRQRSRHPGATQVPSLPRENEQGPRASLRPTPLRPQG